MAHTRAYTSRQKRHPGSQDPSHIRDKQQGEARRKTSYVAVPAPVHPSPSRPFYDLGLRGHERRRTPDGKWVRCTDPKEFGDYLEREAAVRDWYQSTTSRHGRPVNMVRHVACSVEILTITFAPWLSDHICDEFRAGRDPRPDLGNIRDRWIAHAEKRLQATRHLLGYAFHADTDDLHLDLCMARQDGRGGRIGPQGLGLMGDWVVGASRQSRNGAKISTEKRRRLERDFASFHHRYGSDLTPLDIELSRKLDVIAEDVIGLPLQVHKQRYLDSVPALERAHAAAKLAALDAARAKLMAANPKDVTPAPTSTPTFPKPEDPSAPSVDL